MSASGHGVPLRAAPYLEENIAAATRLDAEMVARRSPWRREKNSGPRYGQRGMAMVDR
ncbi:hypothetical protein ACFSQT_06895 [Mesorhizobium calcicola]|uniref:Uncharacterized protein n=1 Tax=Mesorhizobium calcicola TaxID=1300310 RepID=A0ABW4WAQ2_9HYPH